MTSGLLTVRLLRLRTREQLAAAHDPDPALDRMLTVVQLETNDGPTGWGECSALNRPTYTAEFAEGAFAALTEGSPQPASMPMATAALEMAELDAELKRSGTSLAAWLGASSDTVKAGIAVGLLEPPELESSIGHALDAGYRRIKVKLVPGDAAQRVRLIRSSFADVEFELHGDANGSFAASSVGELRLAIDEGLDLIEQPFAPDDIAHAAALVSDAPIPVVADEAIPTLEAAHRLHRAKAFTGIALKPARLAGLKRAAELLQWSRSNGVACSAGGMLESGLGRRSLAAFAALDGMTLTGDVSPAGRWLAEDPWPDLEMVGDHILVPTTPGVAPEPDGDVLERVTVRRSERRIP